MIQIGDYGKYETVPRIVEDIIKGDTEALDRQLAARWKLNNAIELSERTRLLPIEIALIVKQERSVEWLVEHGAELNTPNHLSFLTALRYCDSHAFIRYLVEHGAKIDGDAFQQALYGKKYENLPLIHELGHTVQEYGGGAFRSAVLDRDYRACDFFMENGVDVNYNKRDQVFPLNQTPLCVAALYADLKMAKYLVEHGADVTLADKEGMRPYNLAVERGDKEMAAYFKSLEPVDFHDLQNKLLELKGYKLPKPLLDFLQGDALRIDFKNPGKYDARFVEFFPLVDTVPMKIKRQNMLRISREVDNYGSLYIVWHPKTKHIGCYDMEHEEFHDIAPFEDFIGDAEGYLHKVICGET